MSEAVSEVKRRKPAAATEPGQEAPAAPPKEKPAAPPPFLLDFYPLEDERSTRLAAFFDRLRAGRLSTTRCAKDGLLWPPRVVCPRWHTEVLDWVVLPEVGHVYAFSAVLAGAPLGMESDLPFVVGLVVMDGAPLRLFGRITGRAWNEVHIGQRVRVESYTIPDGRVFYRFAVDGP